MAGEQNMGGTGWWLASDGRFYPPDLHPSQRKTHDLRDAIGTYRVSDEASTQTVAIADQPLAQGPDAQRRGEQTVIDLSAPVDQLEADTVDEDAHGTASTSHVSTTLQRRCRSCWQMTCGYTTTCEICGADPTASPARVQPAATPVSIFAAPDPAPATQVPASSTAAHVPSSPQPPRRSVIAEAFGLPRAGSILITAGCLIAIVGTMCTALLGERFNGELRLITVMSGLAVTAAFGLTLMGIGHSLRVSRS